MVFLVILAIIIILQLLGLIPAYIAQKKGDDFGSWWAYGSLLFIIALPHAIFMKPKYLCPFCKSAVNKEAIVCCTCNRELVEIESLGVDY